MNRDRNRAAAGGALFIVATTASLLGRAVLLDPILEGAGFLAEVAANQDRTAAGALLGLVAYFASASIAIALYPVLRRYGEGVLYSLGAIAVLASGTLARGLAEADAATRVSLQASGDLLMAVRSWAGIAGTLAFYPAGLLYYLVFFGSRLIPRWLSGWGIAAVAMGFTASILVVFHIILPMSAPQIVLNFPIFLQEMVLAVWLIARGFSRPAASGDAR